jgi:hypothetical protein
MAAMATAAAAQAQAAAGSAQILARVSEEAEAFRQNLPRTLTQETLDQRAIMPLSRFRPRAGASALAMPKPRLVTHEVVSEYSVGTLKGSDSNNLFEFRQVTTVDGRPVQSAESARRALTLGIRSQDERQRKRMLEEFAKFGLVDVASDYGLILLAFTKRGMEGMKIEPAGQNLIGAETALLFAWKQTTAEQGELAFRGREAVREPMHGTLWVRASDGLPLRVEASAQYVDRAKHKIRDDASVDYQPSRHGFLTPVSVVHRHLVDGQLMTENLYRYEPFKMFAADAEIEFTELPGPQQPVKK